MITTHCEPITPSTLTALSMSTQLQEPIMLVSTPSYPRLGNLFQQHTGARIRNACLNPYQNHGYSPVYAYPFMSILV